MQMLRARCPTGHALVFSTEQDDAWWWLMQAATSTPRACC
jgi:hypothetical protein